MAGIGQVGGMTEGADTREPLTARQAEWLEAVRAHYARHGTPPTMRELCEAMGLSTNSTSAAANALRFLAERGLLTALTTRRGHTRYIPSDRPGGGATPARSPRVSRAAAQLRRQAAEMRKRADELERL